MNVSSEVPKKGIINTTFHSQISIVITLDTFLAWIFLPLFMGSVLIYTLPSCPIFYFPLLKVKMSGKQDVGIVLMGHSTINATMPVGVFHLMWRGELLNSNISSSRHSCLFALWSIRSFICLLVVRRLLVCSRGQGDPRWFVDEGLDLRWFLSKSLVIMLLFPPWLLGMPSTSRVGPALLELVMLSFLGSSFRAYYCMPFWYILDFPLQYALEFPFFSFWDVYLYLITRN